LSPVSMRPYGYIGPVSSVSVCGITMSGSFGCRSAVLLYPGESFGGCVPSGGFRYVFISVATSRTLVCPFRIGFQSAQHIQLVRRWRCGFSDLIRESNRPAGRRLYFVASDAWMHARDG